MERKSPNVSPHASDGVGDEAHYDEGDASDDEGDGKTVTYEVEENNDT